MATKILKLRIVQVLATIISFLALAFLVVVRFWHLDSPQRADFAPEATIAIRYDLRRLAITPDRMTVVGVRYSPHIQFVELDKSECSAIPGNMEATSVAISPSGEWCVIGGTLANRAVLEVWNMKSRCLRDRFDLGVGKARFAGFDPSGHYVYAAICDNKNDSVVRIDTNSRRIDRVFDLKMVAHLLPDDNVGIVVSAIAPGGNELVIDLAGPGTIVWDLKTSTERLVIPDKGISVSRLAVSPDRKQIALAGTGVRVLDFQTGKQIHERRLGRPAGGVSAIEYSSDSKILVAIVTSGKSFPRHAIVWNTEDYSTESVFFTHTDSVRAMAFIPGTHKIVTASDDCKLQVWDLDDLLAQRLQKKGPGGDGEGPRE